MSSSRIFKYGIWCWVNEDGIFHREDGPAIEEDNDGRTIWYMHGKKHRENGPAVIRLNGDVEYWFEGNRHRNDGPAINSYRVRCWYLNGKLHREDGPAVIWCNGVEEFWINNTRIDSLDSDEQELIVIGKSLKN